MTDTQKPCIAHGEVGCPRCAINDDAGTFVPDVNITVLLDGSGSMSSLVAQTMAGFNEYVNGLKQDKAANYSLGLIIFRDDSSTVAYMARPIADVPTLDGQSYWARGGTPLYDALDEAMTNLEKIITDPATGVIIAVNTDGNDTTSHKTTKKACLERLAQLEKTKNWTFTWMGANPDAFTGGEEAYLGTKGASNIASYANVGVAGAFTAMRAATTQYANNRSYLGRTFGKDRIGNATPDAEVQAELDKSKSNFWQGTALEADSTTEKGADKRPPLNKIEPLAETKKEDEREQS